MSYEQHPTRKQRLNRSTLAVPGSNVRMIQKAADSAVDHIFLDCEDAVAPDDKEQARKNIIEALNDIDWKAKGKTMSVRINGIDTHYMYRDVVDVMEQAGQHLDLIMIPKAGTVSDVYMVEALLSQIEAAKGYEHKVGVEVIIETPLGMANIMDMARNSKRLEAMHFGVADYAAFTRARTQVIGGLHDDYPGDMWHNALANIVVACRAYGLRPIDGPFGDFSDEAAMRATCLRASVLGCEGKWAIHPSQIDVVNEIFSPTEKEVTQARRILEAMKEAAAQGKGAASLDGKMIDAASEKMARNVISMDEAIRNKTA